MPISLQELQKQGEIKPVSIGSNHVSLQELQKQGEIKPYPNNNLHNTLNDSPSLAQNILGGVNNAMAGVSNFLFGSTSKTVGNLIGGFGESVEQLTRPKKLEQNIDSALTQKLRESGMSDQQIKNKFIQEPSKTFNQNATPLDTAFTTLEILPGGGIITDALKKLPGGEQVAKSIANSLSGMSDALKQKALKQYASIFNPTSKYSKSLSAKATPKLLEQGKIITSTEALGETAQTKLSKYGKEINNYLKEISPEVKTNLLPTIDKLEKMKSKYVIGGKVFDQPSIDIITNIQSKLSQYGKEISTNDAVAVRRLLDESIDKSGGFIVDKATKFTAEVEKNASNSLRNEIAKDNPSLNVLNSKYSFWSNVKELSKYASGKKPVILRRALAGTVGGFIGGQQGSSISGKIEAASIGALLGERGMMLFKSPAWVSLSAITKNKIADYLAKGDKKAISEIIKRIAIGTNNQ